MGLAVTDPTRSLEFYRDTLGLDFHTFEVGHGYVITFTDGSNMVLLRGTPPSTMGNFHFGICIDTPEEVRAIRSRLQAKGAKEVEWADRDGYVSCSVQDPDGYRIQFACAAHLTAGLNAAIADGKVKVAQPV
jgi:catechol 2,3-dioxygenase-like lactoylglutathione lyase family enzyme